MKIYEGMIKHSEMSKDELQGYSSWKAQRRRCYCKTSKSYKNYGLKGLTVEYGSREFVGWWIYNLSLKDWKKPTCGRIDHSKGYSFDNIKMEELADNSKEVFERLGSRRPKIPCVLYNPKTGNELIVFKSRVDAAKNIGKNSSLITMLCNGTAKQTREGFAFKDYRG